MSNEHEIHATTAIYIRGMDNPITVWGTSHDITNVHPDASMFGASRISDGKRVLFMFNAVDYMVDSTPLKRKIEAISERESG